MATAVPRKSDRKLQLILRHAATVFAEKGFEGASIRDISRSCRISLSGLYYYFESKQKLLFLIQSRAFTSILERLQLRLQAEISPEKRLRLLVENHVDYFLSHPLEMKVLSHEAEALEEPFRREVVAIKRRYYKLALRLYQDLARAGGVRAANARVAVLGLFGMMNWIYTWHNPKVDPSAEALSGIIAGIFLEGVKIGNAHSAAPLGRRESSRRGAGIARAERLAPLERVAG